MASPPDVRRRLCLAAASLNRIGLCPWFELGSSTCVRHMLYSRRSLNQGHSPNRRGLVTARQSRRLTSGGKADATHQQDSKNAILKT